MRHAIHQILSAFAALAVFVFFGAMAAWSAEKDPEPPKGGIKYATPEGWKSVKPDPIVHAAFRLPDSTRDSPDVTIVPLNGEGGGLLNNLNRWRAQVGLKPIDEVPKDLKKVSVAGKEYPYVDLTGPAGPDQHRVLAVVCKNGPTTWFFKLRAPVELAAKQKAAFEALVKSVRFDAGPGDK